MLTVRFYDTQTAEAAAQMFKGVADGIYARFTTDAPEALLASIKQNFDWRDADF